MPRDPRLATMRRLATLSVVLLVGGLAVVAIVAGIVNDGSPSRAHAVGSNAKTEFSLCDSSQLELSIRATGFGAHVAALRLSGSQPCDVGELHVTVTVVGRNGQRVPTEVAPPEEFAGTIHPTEELIATFDYTTRCRRRGPLAATVLAVGEIGAVTATAPVGFRRDPFTTSPCKAG
jgi:hypothetical protein